MYLFMDIQAYIILPSYRNLNSYYVRGAIKCFINKLNDSGDISWCSVLYQPGNFRSMLFANDIF